MVEALAGEGFRFVGEWRSALCRVHSADWLRRKPGLYAFAVRDEIVYVGMAAALHRRLRNYSNRCFRPVGAKVHRHCHREIIAAVGAGRVVQVFAKPMDIEEIRAAEAELIRRFSPHWNRTLA